MRGRGREVARAGLGEAGCGTFPSGDPSLSRLAAAAFLLPLLASGCGVDLPGAGGEGTAPELVQRDSAGIRIVEVSTPRWEAGEGWRIDPEPVIEIGALEGAEPYLFSRIDRVTRLADGRFALVETQRREVRVFDPEGRHIVTLGGRGQGPGELQSIPDFVILPGDTVLVFDYQALRYTWFTMDGRVVRDESLPGEEVAEHFAGAVPRERILFPDRSIFHAGMVPPPDVRLMESAQGTVTGFAIVLDALQRRDLRLGVLRPGSARAFVLGPYPGDESGFVQEGASIMSVANDHFAPTLYAVSRDPLRIHVATAGRREIVTVGSDGVPLRILRQLVPLVPLRTTTISAKREALLDEAEEREIPARLVMDLFDQIAFPDSAHPYAALHADSDGNLWALDHDPDPGSDDTVRTFQIFDPEGAWLGPVSVPASIGTIQEIGEGHLLTVRTDELGVPYLRVNRIIKEGGG